MIRFFLFIALAGQVSIAFSGDNAGKIARKWVREKVKPLSTDVARETIRQTLYHLNFQALNASQQNYKKALEHLPSIEKQWALLKHIDFESTDVPTIHVASKKIFQASQQIQSSLFELNRLKLENQRLTEEYERLYSGENPAEFFHYTNPFPKVSFPEINLLDGVHMSGSVRTGPLTDEDRQQQNQGNLLKGIYDTASNFFKVYKNYKSQKELERAEQEFREQQITEQEYFLLTHKVIAHVGTKGLELTQKVNQKIVQVYDDAVTVDMLLKQALVYFIQRRDQLIDQSIDEKIRQEIERFDEQYYYPHLHGLDLTFVEKQRELKQKLGSLDKSNPQFLIIVERISIERKALERLRLKWKKFKQDGEGS